jgi:hypothetical protein
VNISEMPSLTIVTVAGPNDGPLIERNAHLMRRMNPGVFFELYVIDNSRHAGGACVHENELWKVVDGISTSDSKISPQSQASSQHGLALNSFIANHTITNRYLLVLDPDFFIYFDNWIGSVTAYMSDQRLDFFGAPWHPKWFTKYRGFPCVHCLFIDTHSVDIKSLDFTPDIKPTLAADLKKTKFVVKIKTNLFSQLLSLIYSMSLLRLDIGKTKDTGGKIHAQALAHPMRWKSGLLLPCLHSDEWIMVAHLRHKLGRWVEKAVPNRWSFFPDKRSGYSYKSLVSSEISQDIANQGWEEFQWQSRVFGIHMRRFANKTQGKMAADKLLDQLDLIHGQPSSVTIAFRLR